MTTEIEEIGLLATSITQSHMLPHDHAAILDTDLWTALEESGLTLVSVAESAGGSGGDLDHAAAVLKAVSSFGVRIPLAETAWLAAWLLAGSGLMVPKGPLSAAVGTDALRLEQRAGTWVVDGVLDRVPWGEAVGHVVVLFADGHVAMIPTAAATAESGANLADEPRSNLRFDQVEIPTSSIATAGPGISVEAFGARATLARCVAMAGSSAHILQITLRYASERTQFGRKLRDLQVIQQYLAQIASGTALLGVAAEGALVQLSDGETPTWTVAAAKSIAAEVVDTIATLSHQIFGAIGITEEHELHRHTKRLRSWNLEEGHGMTSATTVAATFFADPETSLWEMVVEA